MKFHCFFEFACESKRITQRKLSDKRSNKFVRVAKIFHCLDKLCRVQITGSKIVIRKRIARLELSPFIIILDCLLEVALLMITGAKIQIRSEVRWVGGDGFLQPSSVTVLIGSRGPVDAFKKIQLGRVSSTFSRVNVDICMHNKHN